MKKFKKTMQKVLSVSLAATVAVSVAGVPVFAQEGDGSTDIIGTTTKEEYGKISLVEAEKFTTLIPIEADTDVSKINWTMTRNEEKEYLSLELYPTPFAGGALSDFGCYKEPDMDWIKNVTTTKENIDGKTYAKLTFETVPFFVGDVSVPQINGGDFMDYCGYFDLTGDIEGVEIGTTLVKIVPYDNFNTMDEIYVAIDEMEAFAAENTDLYVEKFSMGKSTNGFDMPYLIIADSKEAVDNWLAYSDVAETDPEAAKAMLEKSGEDLRVPILYSNIHANEYAAVDGLIAFGWSLLNAASNIGEIEYTNLTGFTEEGKAELEKELKEDKVAIPELVAEDATYLGYLHVDNFDEKGSFVSGPVDMDKYYTKEEVTVDVDALLDDVFYILVPEQNVEGRTYMLRTSSNGYDLNRDNSFQITPETQNMQHLIGTYNPVSFTEFHGRVRNFQCEPCNPPHEPNFEYDLLSESLMKGGEAFGIAAVANNDGFNSYVIPQRDYLTDNGDGTTYWADPWDDMSTSYTPQFAMLHGTVSYTVELPAHSDETVDAVQYGAIGQSMYIAENKINYMENQAKIYERGITNFNSNAYDLVGQWFANQYDVEGAESDIFRPVFDGEGENGNFYPECYIIPMDGENQSNLQAAYDMMEWLSRNDVKIKVTEEPFTYEGVTYPEGTMIISMYQAKRSVANSALYDGTLINDWTVLYSEGITTFNETRGFEMETVVKPGEMKKIDAVTSDFMGYKECLEYIDSLGGYFVGDSDSDVVISNVSEDSTRAINALLDAGKKVGMITDETSEYYGDFICSYDDYATVKDTYVLTATGVSTNAPKAEIIEKAPTVFLTGEPMAEPEGGYVGTKKTVGNYTWSYDRAALDMMGFAVTQDISAADVVVGGSELTGDALAAVKAGVPYLGYSVNAAKGYANLFDTEILTRSRAEGMDCLGSVIYPTTSLINGSYVMDEDDILYGYGLGYFSKIPAEAEVLVQMDGSKEPSEGFIKAITEEQEEKMDTFLDGSIQAISYTGPDKDGNAVDVTMFANTLTQKVHQQDEFAFISNFVFSNLCTGEEY